MTTRIFSPATTKVYPNKTVNVYVKVEYTTKDGKDRLSLTGVEGPKRDGDADGRCGQISLGDDYAPRLGWTQASMRRLWEIWDAWHLNDMRAGCEHQRANWNLDEQIEVVSYKLTMDAYKLRQQTFNLLASEALHGRIPDLTPTARALAEMEKWYSPEGPPDADSPLSGCLEVDKREMKYAGWVYPKEHPRGLLCKPCEVCGYKYGDAWLHEPVPPAIIAELMAFPESPERPAWV